MSCDMADGSNIGTGVKKRKRRFGDRRDGRRLRTLPPLNALMPFIMKTRNDANNNMSDAIEITEAERFLRKKRISGYPGMGILHLFIAAYVRVVSQYPAINRFVSGQRIYARNEIVFIMVVKKEMRTDCVETSIKIVFDPRDTINDIYAKLNAEIVKVKDEGEDTDADDAARMLMKMPRVLLKFCVFFLGILDYFGKLPKSLLKASPFHGSVFITDLGSIGLPPLYHHLYNFGNMPVFLAIGAKRKAVELKPDGGVVTNKYVDYKLVMDERICDGFYFAYVIKYFKSIYRNPQILDEPPETVVEDID